MRQKVLCHLILIYLYSLHSILEKCKNQELNGFAVKMTQSEDWGAIGGSE